MTFVAIADLKARLSEYLARVQAGEALVVADRGRPVARLVPIEPIDEADLEMRRLLSLEREGIIERGTITLPASFWDMERPKDPDASVRAALDADRDETL